MSRDLVTQPSVVALMLALGVVAPPVAAEPTPSVVRINNAWTADDTGQRPDVFVHVEHKRLEAGPIEPDWQSAMWTIEPVDGTPFVRLRNHWQPERYIHVEHGKVKAGAIEHTWHSAMWEIVPVPETDSVWIRSRWKPDRYLHVQRGRLTTGRIKTDWLAARWHLNPI